KCSPLFPTRRSSDLGAIVQTEARRVTERAVGRRVSHDDDLTAGAQERPRRLVSRVGVREGQRAEDQDRRRAGHGATRTARHVETPCPGVRAFTRTAMFPYGWLFSSISWWHSGMSSKA